MTDYFEELKSKLSNKNSNIEIISNSILKCRMNHIFNLFEFGISDETKYIYNNYKKFLISWEEKKQKLHGFVDFVPYEKIVDENKNLCEMADNIEEGVIENQNIVISNLKNWYPIFKFPNGDAFCYDKRNGLIVFFEHELFDTGGDLNGLIIANTIDSLLKNWSKVLFVDIYDWSEGVNEQGIDLGKSIYEKIIQISEKLE